MSLPKKTESACEGCSNCCKYYFQIYSDKLKDDLLEPYLEARSAFKFGTEDGRYVIYALDQPCPKLDENGYCSVYEDRPDYCRIWPTQNQPAWRPNCKLMQERFPVQDNGMRVLKI